MLFRPVLLVPALVLAARLRRRRARRRGARLARRARHRADACGPARPRCGRASLPGADERLRSCSSRPGTPTRPRRSRAGRSLCPSPTSSWSPSRDARPGRRGRRARRPGGVGGLAALRHRGAGRPRGAARPTSIPCSAESSSTRRSGTSASCWPIGCSRRSCSSGRSRSTPATAHATPASPRPGRSAPGCSSACSGSAIVWLAQLPFALAALWWERRHDVSEVGYLEAVFGGWLGLGGTFVADLHRAARRDGAGAPSRQLVVDPGRGRLRR